jgi:hypothetical protein
MRLATSGGLYSAGMRIAISWSRLSPKSIGDIPGRPGDRQAALRTDTKLMPAPCPAIPE